jgi:hypothetical protein
MIKPTTTIANGPDTWIGLANAYPPVTDASVNSTSTDIIHALQQPERDVAEYDTEHKTAAGFA